jgi:TolB-like protein/tetratricopeptide (TPR) repeat protein
MPVLSAQADDPVGDGEIRLALERMAASEAFRGSPQLIAFLRYVVEATLRGQADRIKGYTIATEALGRTVDFDPQADPIVRVEATRLRRALTRYHASAIGADGVLIDLPLGSYVPVFRRAVASVVLPLPPPASPPPAPRRLGRFALPPVNWRHAAAGLALMLLGAGSYAGLDFWFDFTPSTQPIGPARAAQSPAAPEPLRTLIAFPAVFVGTFQASGDANAQVAADSLRAKLRDALARFDELNVMGGAPPGDDRARGAANSATASQYTLTASVETGSAGLSVTVRLTDIADSQIVFARTFERTRYGGDAGPGEEAIVREVAAALAQPYGIIQARERTRQTGSSASNPHYRCLLDAYDYWRSFDPASHAHVRDCLERATEADPSFAAGFSMLTEIILQEDRRALNLRPGDAPPLERALRAARRACEIKPGSAQVHQALMDAYFSRGEYALALEAGERAAALNPYSPNILALYGARLISLGEQEKGVRLIKEAAELIVVRPAWMDFYLFLAAYLADDRAGAASYSAQITTEKFLLGLLAQAIVAAQRGNPDVARQLIGRVDAFYPAFAEDPQRELKKLFPSDAVTGRLMHDLALVRAGATN